MEPRAVQGERSLDSLPPSLGRSFHVLDNSERDAPLIDGSPFPFRGFLQNTLSKLS
jgi:hypothetical protein